MFAASNGHADTLQALIDAGADVDDINLAGVTSLMLAVGNGHIGSVKTLLEDGADVHVKSNKGSTALSLAKMQGHHTIVQLLTERKPGDVINELDFASEEERKKIFLEYKSRRESEFDFSSADSNIVRADDLVGMADASLQHSGKAESKAVEYVAKMFGISESQLRAIIREREANLGKGKKEGAVSVSKAHLIGERHVAPDNTFISPFTGAKFVLIPSGTFIMGSPSDERGRLEDETPHQVTITKLFYMQTTEVTQGQWTKVMGENPSYFKDCGDNCPVEEVSWNDTQSFIAKLNSMENTDKYRLPTEAEWEYAARAGSQNERYGDISDIAWYDSNSGGKTHPVAQKKSNTFGLYDMLGNVWEWCNDWYAHYPLGHVTDPIGPSSGPSSGMWQVVRGASWADNVWNVRTAYRYSGNLPGIPRGGVGFRLVRT